MASSDGMMCDHHAAGRVSQDLALGETCEAELEAPSCTDFFTFQATKYDFHVFAQEMPRES
jgi:hypothetical protein